MRRESVWHGVDVDTPEAGRAALKIFFRIAEAWHLTEEQQVILLGTRLDTLRQWKAGHLEHSLDHPTQERLSHIFGIFAALQALLPIPERADTWLSRPNSAAVFGGHSALTRMLGGELSDLAAVHQYLSAAQHP